MTNYEDTNDVVHHLRFQAALDEAVCEEAAFQAFEEHFKASAEDPYFENELKLWLTAWRKALDYFTRQAAPVRRTLTTTNNTDPVRELVDQWREVAEYFTGSTGLDIRETLIDCADDLEAALAQQQSAAVGVEASYHPCTSILIEGLKRLEGGSDVLAEWDRARAQGASLHGS